MKLLFDYQLYEEFILKEIPSARESLLIATADIKDMYVKNNGAFVAFLQILAKKLKEGVEIKLLHAKEPGVNFRKDFDKYPVFLSSKKFHRALCPRVHIKMIIIDGRIAYTGSANLTGAGLGAKGKYKRNFESGVILEDGKSIKLLRDYFEKIFSGSFCGECQRREYCSDPLDFKK